MDATEPQVDKPTEHYRRLGAGKCASCGNPRQPNMSRCQSCHDKVSEKNRAERGCKPWDGHRGRPPRNIPDDAITGLYAVLREKVERRRERVVRARAALDQALELLYQDSVKLDNVIDDMAKRGLALPQSTE